MSLIRPRVESNLSELNSLNAENKSSLSNFLLTPIVVNSCDAYCDVIPLFFAALNEYWPDCRLKVIINNETYCKSLETSITTSETTWGERFKSVLLSLTSEYVIVLFDDYILESTIDTCKVSEIFSFMDNNPSVAVHYLNAVCFKTHKDEPFLLRRKLKDRVNFRINSAPAIWRREDLINYIGKHDDPWAWEVFGSYRTFGDGKEFYSPGSTKLNLFNYDYRRGGAIYRGKWVEEVALPKIDKYGLDIDTNIRGIYAKGDRLKRTLSWKIKFLVKGYRMVGFRVLYFITTSIREKYFVKK